MHRFFFVMKLTNINQYKPERLNPSVLAAGCLVSHTPSLSPYPPQYKTAYTPDSGLVPTLDTDTENGREAVRKRALAVVHTKGLSRHQNATITPKAKRAKSQRLKEKKDSKGVLIELLLAVGTPDAERQAEKVSRCANQWLVVGCGRGHILKSRPTFSCYNRFCPFCASRRSREHQAKYTPIIHAYLNANPDITPRFITYTLKHTDEGTAKSEALRLKDCLAKLHRRKYWKKYFAGALVSVEVSVGRDGLWHIHAHTISFRRKGSYNNEDLKAEWLEVTGDSVVVNERKLSNIEEGVGELLKYATKPSDVYQWNARMMGELLNLKHMKFVYAVGSGKDGFNTFVKDYTEREAVLKELLKHFPDDEPEGDHSEAGKCTRPNCNAHLLPESKVHTSILMRLLDAEPPDDGWEDRTPEWERLDDGWEDIPSDWEEDKKG